MLQVVDEIDDLACAAVQRCENVVVELGHLPIAVGGVAALTGAVTLGADPTLVCAAALCATLAAILKARSRA